MEARRARSFQEFGQIMVQMFGEAAKLAEAAGPFEARATDVVISPYGKSGTTWLQQIFHQLRTSCHRIAG